MAHRPKLVVRLLAAGLTSVSILLAFASPAAARVSIVPDHATDGGTQTFAFRLADERADTASTRLELVFPQDTPVAYVRVDPVPGWTATITPRPLDPPIKVDGKTISEVAGSVVLQGGSVAPHEFETFPITMGPLPANGRLTFHAIQTFANGEVQHLTGDLAPVITFGEVPPPPEGPAPQAAQTGTSADEPTAGVSVRAVPGTAAAGGGMSPLVVLWTALGLAIVVGIVVGLRARRVRRRTSNADPETSFDVLPQTVPEAEQADEETEGASR